MSRRSFQSTKMKFAIRFSNRIVPRSQTFPGYALAHPLRASSLPFSGVCDLPKISMLTKGGNAQKALGVASKIFTLFSIILELPPDYFSSRHAYDSPSEDHLRYMTYHPRSAADDAKVDNTWSRAHTDFGSLTLLWSQNVAGLQIKTQSGQWKYVPPVDGGIICNVGDTLAFWSAGYLKSTTHRVVRPPEDQTHVDRLGLFYFVRPGDDVDIKPVASPLLKRLGLVSEGQESAEPITGRQYVRERVKNYHNHTDYANMKGRKFRIGNLEIEDEAE